MSVIFWAAIFVLVALWAYKNKETVKGWFKKEKAAPKSTSSATSDCAPKPPSNAPPAS